MNTSIALPDIKNIRRVSARALDKLGLYSLYLSVVLVPLAIAPFAYDQAMSAKAFTLRVLVMLAFISWILKSSIDGFRARWSALFWPAIALIMLASLSALLSISPLTSIMGTYQRYEGLSSMLIYGILLFLSVQYFNSEERRLALAKALIAGAVLVAGYGIIQALEIDPVHWGASSFEMSRTFSTLGNPIILGGYLAVALTAAIVLAISSSSTVEAAPWAVAGIAIAVPLATSLSRGAWIAALMGIAAALAFALRGREKAWARMGRAVAIVAVVAAGGFAILVLAGNASESGSRLLSLAQPLTGSITSRIEIWRSALSMIKSRPLLGFGPDTFKLVFPSYETLESAKLFPETLADNAHNTVLQYAASLGIPALALYLALIGFFFFLIFKDGRPSVAQVALSAGVVAFFVQGLFSVNTVATTFIIWLMMGAAAPSTEEVEFHKNSPLLRLGAVCFCALAVVAILISASFFAADVEAGRGVLIVEQGDVQNGISRLRLAIKLNPTNDVYLRVLSTALQSAAIASRNRAFFDESLIYMKRAIDLEPFELQNYVLLGRFLAYGGEAYDSKYYDGAIEVLNKAIELRRYSPSAHRVLGFVYLKKGQEKRALAELNASLDVNPADERTFFYKGKALEGLGLFAEAMSAYKASLKINPKYEDAQMALRNVEARI